ncbi:hypothetical protein FA95DRAFT_180829 [Auriscalpium vulgare]|uniref:Uncharacterized protein n=1 Tax=Auriscalpium vulgare TaxID=40419 RepID=A0ACB8RLQ0_9AGAM|nr:hypothetical protein FA95DRAFT_180829 [Auriscalpium vulgare]
MSLHRFDLARIRCRPCHLASRTTVCCLPVWVHAALRVGSCSFSFLPTRKLMAAIASKRAPTALKIASTPYKYVQCHCLVCSLPFAPSHGCHEIAPPPPIPDDLRGRTSYYGLVINDGLFAQEHYLERPDNNYTKHSNRRANVLKRAGILLADERSTGTARRRRNSTSSVAAS